MDSLLLSRLTKDFLNQDPAAISQKRRYSLGWAGSILTAHPRKESFKKRLAYFNASPRLLPPRELPPASFAPPRIFSKGNDLKRTCPPIFQLLTETNEMAQARPVPGRIPLLRSICKGKGTLRQNAQGVVFLDIDSRFLAMLLPYLKAHGLTELLDAHIPVISARESAFHYLTQIDQIGKEFTFEIEGLFSVVPTSWPEVEQVWFFKLNSPDLENFRRSQFLSSIPGGHPFHIAVAIQPKAAIHQQPQSPPLMRINPAVVAA